MPIGVINPVFDANVAQMTAAGANVSASTLGTALRAWMMGDPSLWAGEPLDIADIANAFLRTNLGDLYGQVLTDPNGSTGDAASLKVQSDHLAVQERSFRLRHASGLRCALHAASRRAGAGSPFGPPARTEMYAQDLIVAGSAGFVPGG